MKKVITAVVIFLITFNSAEAGSHRSFSQKPLVVAVGEAKLTLMLTQLQMDAVAAGNSNVYSFNIKLNLSNVNSAALNFLYAQYLRCGNFLLTVYDISINNTLNETRSYRNAIITEFSLPSLDIGSHEAGEIVLKLKASTVSTKAGNGEKQAFKIMGKSVSVSNFKMQLDNLPGNRISTISKISFKNLSPSQRCDSISDITIKVIQADAQPWRDWFDSRVNGITRKSGTIQFLAPNMTDVIATVRIIDAVIVSYASSSSGENQVQRATVVLKVKNAELKFE